MTETPSLLNADGSPFSRAQLDEVANAIEGMDDTARSEYREQNSKSIVQCDSSRLLIVSGPGTGKSTLFRQRIKYWLSSNSEKRVFVSSFVKKLVADLQGEITNDDDISNEEEELIRVETLHGLARGIMERSKGIPEIPFKKHVRMLDKKWAPVIWNDALMYNSDLNPKTFGFNEYKVQCDTDDFLESLEWETLRKSYFRLLSFYNAAGFADSIWIAARAAESDSSLSEHEFWIVDEYQDLNFSEDRLVRAVTAQAQGVLMAGDDDQALYESMKSSSTEIIHRYYDDHTFAKAMLPMCSRCSFHICLAAARYIEANREEQSVEKVFQPQMVDESAKRVQVVAIADPRTVVRYIKEFLDSHIDDLKEHANAFREGKASEPFLLLLSPFNGLPFFAKSDGNGVDKKIQELISPWTIESLSMSSDYKKVLTHFQSAMYRQDNFLIRMVLEYAGIQPERVHELLVESDSERLNLIDVIKTREPQIIERLNAVVEILGPPFDSSIVMTRRLQAIMEIENPERLSGELERSPISIFQIDFEIEVLDETETSEKLPLVALMSIAKSKGLSAQHVMILGCDNSNMNKVSPLSFYVAMTRARESLHLITCLKARGNGTAIHLADLPESHCEYLSYTKDGLNGLNSFAGFCREIKRWNSGAEWGKKLVKKRIRKSARS